MERIIIKVVDNAIDAHILSARLESEGIECFIYDEHIVTQNPLLNQAVGGIKVKVYEKDVERSKAILKEISETPYLDEEDKVILCPNCASKNITSGFRSMKGIRGVVSMFIAFILTVFPIYTNYVYRCNDCYEEFKLKAKKLI